MFTGPNIITNGLVLSLDAANPKSYVSGSTTWRDLSGNGNSGSLVNGPTFNSANGGSIVFDGNDDYVNINNQIQFERTNSFTLSAWIRSTNVNNNQILNNENLSYRGYQFSINSSAKVSFFIRSVATTNFIGIATVESISSNAWLLLTSTYNGSSLASGANIYINGLLAEKTIAGDNLSTTTVSNNTTWIGLRRPETQGPFNGRISQIQIYNRALSSQEILQNYNALKSRFNL